MKQLRSTSTKVNDLINCITHTKNTAVTRGKNLNLSNFPSSFLKLQHKKNQVQITCKCFCQISCKSDIRWTSFETPILVGTLYQNDSVQVIVQKFPRIPFIQKLETPCTITLGNEHLPLQFLSFTVAETVLKKSPYMKMIKSKLHYMQYRKFQKLISSKKKYLF